jgi:electron-transferring-flavoprotein dehydrogenase
VPNFKNHGNEVISVSALARFQQRQAEEAGAYVLTETSATQLIVQDGKVVGVRSGDKGRGKDGEPLGNFEPGTDIKAQATVLAEGCWGHLTGAAIREFDLAEGREPQVWELGVKEVWKVPKPLDRVIHTFVQPWPLKVAAKYGQLGGTWLYPMKDEKTGRGPRLDRVRRRPQLPRRDDLRARPAADVQDASARQGHPRGRRAGRLGRQGAPGRRLLVDAEAVDARRGARRRRRRDGRHGGAEGRPPLHPVGDARRRGDLRNLKRASARSSPTRRRSRVHDRHRALPGAQHAPGVPEGLPRAACWRARRSCPRARFRRAGRSGTATTPSRCSSATRRKRYPKPDGKYTFDKLSSVFITGNATRDDAPNHIRVQKHVPREIAETWRWMCPPGSMRSPRTRPSTAMST